MLPVAAVLTDLEGATTPRAFVRDVLFPFARQRLAEWVTRHADDPQVAHELAAVRRMAPGRPEIDVLLHWSDVDAKVTPLKALQGMIWREGFAAGELTAEIWPDVPRCLARWRAAGLKLYVFSPGSVEAQHLVLAHTPDGDLTPMFGGFFDTRIGNKREPDTYVRLAIRLDLPPSELLFLSAGEDELDAASVAGLRTCQLTRPEDGTIASDRHPVAADFDEVAKITALPNLVA